MFCQTGVSNPRPAEYQSDAHPTKLPGPVNPKFAFVRSFAFSIFTICSIQYKSQKDCKDAFALVSVFIMTQAKNLQHSTEQIRWVSDDN